MRVLTSSVLIAEAIVLGLAIPVAVLVGGQSAAVGWLLAALALFCLILPGMFSRQFFLPAGWAVQVAAISVGVIVPMMALLGGVFAALWWTAINLGRRAEAG